MLASLRRHRPPREAYIMRSGHRLPQDMFGFSLNDILRRALWPSQAVDAMPIRPSKCFGAMSTTMLCIRFRHRFLHLGSRRNARVPHSGPLQADISILDMILLYPYNNSTRLLSLAIPWFKCCGEISVLSSAHSRLLTSGFIPLRPCPTASIGRGISYTF